MKLPRQHILCFECALLTPTGTLSSFLAVILNCWICLSASVDNADGSSTRLPLDAPFERGAKIPLALVRRKDELRLAFGSSRCWKAAPPSISVGSFESGRVGDEDWEEEKVRAEWGEQIEGSTCTAVSDNVRKHKCVLCIGALVRNPVQAVDAGVMSVSWRKVDWKDIEMKSLMKIDQKWEWNGMERDGMNWEGWMRMMSIGCALFWLWSNVECMCGCVWGLVFVVSCMSTVFPKEVKISKRRGDSTNTCPHPDSTHKYIVKQIEVSCWRTRAFDYRQWCDRLLLLLTQWDRLQWSTSQYLLLCSKSYLGIESPHPNNLKPDRHVPNATMTSLHYRLIRSIILSLSPPPTSFGVSCSLSCDWQEIESDSIWSDLLWSLSIRLSFTL